MDGIQIAMLVLQLVLGALLGLVVWIVRDMRGDQKKRLDAVEGRVGQLELLVAGHYVTRAECTARHVTVDAKLAELDRERGRTEKDMAVVRAQLNGST